MESIFALLLMRFAPPHVSFSWHFLFCVCAPSRLIQFGKAALHGQLDKMLKLLDDGVDINSKDIVRHIFVLSRQVKKQTNTLLWT